MQPIKDIVELRRYVTERLPHVRLFTEEALTRSIAHSLTGLPRLDQLLGGGLPKGALTEVVSTKPSSGSALLLWTLLRQAQERNQWVALVDAHDSFDAAACGDEMFSRFLWVRCHGAAQALKAADLLLRDGNLPLIILDLCLNSPAESRKIPSSIWHRFQRLVQPRSTSLLVLSPQPMVSSAHIRLNLHYQFTLEALDLPETELLNRMLAHITTERSAANDQRERLKTAM